MKFESIVTSEFTRARETGDIIAAELGATCARDGSPNETLPPSPALVAVNQKPLGRATLRRQPARREATCWCATVMSFAGSSARHLGADLTLWTQMEIANCSLTMISIRANGTAILQIFNDTAHVPIEKQTWSLDNGPLWTASVPNSRR